ncbi:putative leucine-richprotein [Trypanosoma rangeli]|uniref:Putative leucine-richprotein n=1 Tax=Trypanosoma rangeli TaxID=5698 RepID=A0A3R7NL91_TRYRA|nr:putative leucine-richprotein [Trypanosoma rangeli]RNF04292.1 putative leucine-richprotein [Trypanosoma rangeli]|eukprot:RNF04292.1 putative leucine-richprotein [Trypanosoma rangeli]
MTSSHSSAGSEESEELCVLVAYEEVAPTKTKEQLIKEQLQELYDYKFPVFEPPEDDPSGKLAYLDACENLHKESFMKFPTKSVAQRIYDGKELLDLSFFGLRKKGSIALAAALRVNLSIKTLTLVGNHITPTGGMEIARSLSESKTVTSLDFSQNRLGARDPGETVRGGAVVSELLRTGNILKTLLLRENGLGDQHVAEFVEAAIDNTELYSLDLSFNKIGYLGAMDLAQIFSRNADLREINLEWNQFQTMGSCYILKEGLLVNNTIKRFNLSSDGLDDTCAQLVGRIIGENAIEEIIIAHNRIGPSGAEAIAKGLLATSALTTLNLDDNPLQSEGCSALIRVAAEAGTLKHLSLQHCRCSAEVVSEAEKLVREVRQDIVILISEDCCPQKSNVDI